MEKTPAWLHWHKKKKNRKKNAIATGKTWQCLLLYVQVNILNCVLSTALENPNWSNHIEQFFPNHKRIVEAYSPGSTWSLKILTCLYFTSETWSNRGSQKVHNYLTDTLT